MILDPISLYCARTGPGPWVEIYALIAALGCFPVGIQVLRWGRERPVLRGLGWMMLLVGLALVWQHSYPSLASILLLNLLTFVITLTLFFLVNRDVLGSSLALSAVLTGLILPFTAISLSVVSLVPGISSTAAYGGILLMILGYAALLRREAPATARRLFAAAITFAVAMLARAADSAVCPYFPQGTHFIWLLGVAALLWQLPRLYLLHLRQPRGGLAGQGRGR